MWLLILEMMFKIVFVLVLGIVVIFWIACKYKAIDFKEEQKGVKNNKKINKKKVKEGK